MGYSSQTGQVGFKIQDAKGTYKDPGAAAPNAGKFMRLRSGALGVTRELLTPDPEIGGTRDMIDATLGAVGFAGEYAFYARLESMASVLFGVSGAKSSSTAGVSTALVGTHVITPANALPWLSVEESVSTFDTFNYTDVKINTFHLEVDANGYLMGTAGLGALKGEGGKTRTAVPDWDTLPLLVGTNTVVKWNTVQVPGKSFTLDINNNMEMDDHRLGTIFLDDFVEKRRDCTAGLVIRPTDRDFWRGAVYGSTSATAPQPGASLKGDLEVTITSFEPIGTSVVPYTFVFHAPHAIVRPFALTQSGDDVMQNTLAFQIVKPDPVVDLYTATIKNGMSAVV